MTGRISYPEFKFQVALGLIGGWETFRKFGYNDDIDSGTEDIWSAGGIKTWPSAAGVVTVSSGDPADDADPAGTGAWTVVVQGLDANWLEIEETFTMNGTSNVVGSKSFLRVHRMYVATAGTNGANVGRIAATIGGNEQAGITANHGQSNQTHYSVPANKTLIITRYHISAGKETSGDQALILSQYRNIPAGQTSWRSQLGMAPYQGVYANENILFVVPEKSDLRVQCISDFSNFEVSADYGGFLVESAAIDIL